MSLITLSLSLVLLPTALARGHSIWHDPHTISGAEIAGIVLGVVGGIALIIGTVFLVIYVRRRRRDSDQFRPRRYSPHDEGMSSTRLTVPDGSGGVSRALWICLRPDPPAAACVVENGRVVR